MLPKKLFSPKCLHPDRNIVFKDDLKHFYIFILQTFNVSNIKEEMERISEFTYKNYKMLYKTKRISMLHFSRSKEENAKEYFEVLFGEIQSFFFSQIPELPILSYFHKVFSIYTLYSIYYTQITKQFYQINTVLEYLQGINDLIEDIYAISPGISFQIYMMMNKLKKDDAFSVGIIPGLKTIILNKYGLPLEQKTNVYQDYLDIFTYKKEIEMENDNFSSSMNEYINIKKGIIDSIKSLDIDKEEYVSYLNENFVESSPNININSIKEREKLNVDDLSQDKVTNFDCLFNKIF